MSDTTAAAGDKFSYDIAQILKALPHRYPLLLVDKVKSIDLGERIHAVKAVSFNEEFFQGHFPGAPIMPGVLQVEAMAQAAAILGIETLELAGTGKLVFFMGIENAKFRAPVTPGCLLDMHNPRSRALRAHRCGRAVGPLAAATKWKHEVKRTKSACNIRGAS